jgi:hypothetical protein
MSANNKPIQGKKKEAIDPSTDPDLHWQEVGTCDKDLFHLSHFYDESED